MFSSSRPSFHPSRAFFSPIRHARSFNGVTAPATAFAPTRTARDVAERSFVRRWSQPGLLDRAEPTLTRHHE